MDAKIAEEIARLKAENESLAKAAAIDEAMSSPTMRPVDTLVPVLKQTPHSFAETPASLDAWNRLRPRNRSPLTPIEREILALRVQNMNLAQKKTSKRAK